MKKLILVSLAGVALSSITVACANPAGSSNPQLQLQDTTNSGSPITITPGAIDNTWNNGTPQYTPVVWTFTATNTGKATLSLSGGASAIASSNAAFTMGTPSATTLQPGDSATVTLTYPTTGGCGSPFSDATTMSVKSNDPNTGSLGFTVNLYARWPCS